MAAIPGSVAVTGFIAPTDSNDTYASHSEVYGRGGFRSVANTTERDAITVDRRLSGMLVFCVADGITYQLAANLTTWTTYTTTGVVPSDVMLKSVYDPNNDGVVTNSDQLGGQVGSYYLSRTNHTGAQAISTVTGLQAALDAKVDDSQIGAANGIVPLNAGVTIDPIYLPISSPIDPVEAWNVITNTPTLADGGVFTAGNAYVVTVSGNPTARNLGSGSQNWSDGDLAIYTAGNIFIRVPRAGVGVSQITTASGVLTGAVTLNSTSYLNDSSGKRFVTDNVQAGLNASPNPVTAANPVATQADLTSLIVVGNGYFLPELFADGQTLGDGTLRLLNTLTNPATGVAYTNLSAASVWTRVNSAYTINVATMSIDWIAWQEAMLAMAQDGYSKISSPGGRGYCPSQSIILPFDQTAVAQYRRSKKFIFDLAGSALANRTATNFRIFDKYPVNQAQANGLQLDYAYKFMDGTFYGRGTNNEADCGIRLGATSGSTLENINFEEIGMGADLQFCLQSSVVGCEVTDFGLYGIALRDGLWSGAGANIAQTNNNVIQQFRSYSGTGQTPTAAIYLNGNRNTWINTAGFEGDNGCQHQIFYDYNGATTVKNLLNLENIDFENAGASRAGVRVRSNSGQILWRAFNTQVSAANMAVLLEVEEAGMPNTNPIGVALEWSAYNNNPGWKLRNIGNPKWYIYNNEMNDNGSILSAANWSTTNGGTIPNAGQVRYQAKL
jgi:hypothetical protein